MPGFARTVLLGANAIAGVLIMMVALTIILIVWLAGRLTGSPKDWLDD